MLRLARAQRGLTVETETGRACRLSLALPSVSAPRQGLPLPWALWVGWPPEPTRPFPYWCFPSLLPGSRWRWACVGQRLSSGACRLSSQAQVPPGLLGSEGLGGRSLPCAFTMATASCCCGRYQGAPDSFCGPRAHGRGTGGARGQARLPFACSEGLCAPLWAPLADSGWPHTFPDTLGLVGWNVWGPGLFRKSPQLPVSLGPGTECRVGQLVGCLAGLGVSLVCPWPAQPRPRLPCPSPI